MDDSEKYDRQAQRTACKCERIARVSAKCDDRCSFAIPTENVDRCDYVPSSVGIGGGDYIKFNYCLDCGKIAGEWPVQYPQED